MKLICKLDPKNSGIIYRTISGERIENRGYNYFEAGFDAEMIFPKGWEVDKIQKWIPKHAIFGENAYYQVIE